MHGDCTENYCNCDCAAGTIADSEAQVCCGMRVDDDGFCRHRPKHPRQITPELLDKAVSAASREATLEAQVRAALKAAF
jgi:hypothetical protein